MKDNTKLLGGLGSLFIVLCVIPYIGALLSLVGMILLIIAVTNYSKEVGKSELSSNFIKGIVISFIGTTLGIIITTAGLGLAGARIYAGGHGIIGWLTIGFGFLISYGFSVVGYNFLKSAFSEIALLTGNNLFDWTGKLLFWGALLSIILIGGIVNWAGWIMATIAFFTTQPPTENTEIQS